MDVPKNVHFLDDLAGVVGFEPTNVGFRIRCLNRTWRYPSTSGAVGETRTLMALTTATSTLRVYQFRHDREMLTVRCLRSIRRVTPLIDLAGVVGFEPTNVGFRIRCLNRTWRYPNQSGAVGETRTLMALTTATSTLRVYQFRHDRETFSVCIWCYAPDASSLLSLTAHPTERLAGVVGFEPTNVGFRIRCLNRTWRYPSKWCGRRDSNSHGSHHSDLNAARLPISPRPRPELFPTDVHPKKRGHQQRRCILPRNFVRGGLIRVFTTRHTIFMGCRLFDR